MESVPGWLVVTTLLLLTALLVVVVALAVALVRARHREVAVLVAAQADSAALRERLEAVERRLAPPVRREEHEYVVTMLGRDEPAVVEPAPLVPGPLFADLVVRESVVQAVSLAAGLRRALAPENRNRIRFEMRREVKRARKQRRTDLRLAKRDLDARRRASVAGEPA